MKYYIFSFIVIFSFLSCTVDVSNPNTITKETFWKTEQDAEHGINAVYNMFYKPGTYSRWLWFRLDLTSDEGYSQSPWAELKEWTRFQYNNYNFWEGNAWTYRDFYEAIFRANQVLEFVPDIEFSDQTKKDQILGQAYFLRGLYYYNLALLWGSENKSVSIVLEVSTPEIQPEGHTGVEVYEQAIDDFSKAESFLPEQWDGINAGRATKGAARGFRAKANMQLHRWDQAKEDLEWFITGQGKQYYDLVDNYFDNFSKDYENNQESIFEIQYSDANLAPAGDGDFDVDPNLGLNRGQFFAPPGIGWTDGELRPWLVDEFKKERDKDGNFDIRLKYSMIYEGMENDFPNNSRIYNLESNSDLWSKQDWKGRVFFRKYSSEYFRDFDDYYNPTNVRLLRYADILLMYAEVLAETGSSLQKAAQYVNMVRNRVNMPDLAINHSEAITNKQSFLKRLQMERVHELATEGHRWADIKRWGLIDDQTGLNELQSRDADFDNFQIGKHGVLPIPSDEVSNNPNIEQNPNY